MPNVKTVYYDRNASGERPEDNVYLKLTALTELPWRHTDPPNRKGRSIEYRHQEE